MVSSTSASYACRSRSQCFSGDHIFGLVPLLSTRSNGAGGMAPGVEDPRAHLDHTAQVGNMCAILEAKCSATLRPSKFTVPSVPEGMSVQVLRIPIRS
jgi:hypothetical protein